MFVVSSLGFWHCIVGTNGSSALFSSSTRPLARLFISALASVHGLTKLGKYEHKYISSKRALGGRVGSKLRGNELKVRVYDTL